MEQGRKLLNYDLESLYSFVRTHGCQAVIIAFQDSEAFDTGLIADLVALFRFVHAMSYDFLN